MHRNAAEEDQAERRQSDSGDRHQPHAESADRRLSEPGADHDPEGDRHERDAGLERAVAKDLLNVDRGEVEHAEEARHDEQHRHVRARQRAHTEDPKPDQRRLRPQLGDDERTEQRSRESEQTERAAGRPAVLLRLDDVVDEDEKSSRDG